MKRILLASALVLGLCPSAFAQNAVVQYKNSQTAPGSTAVTPTTPLPVSLQNGGLLPTGATQLTASGTGTTTATTATLAGVSGKTTYICSFTINSTATAGITGTATITGTLSGTMSFIQGVGTSPAVSMLTVPFTPCIPASAANTDLVVHSVAASTGGQTSVIANGFQL